MKKEQFDIYPFSKETKVKFRGEWSGITEVWFDDRKIGVKETGHLIECSEIEDIKG